MKRIIAIMLIGCMACLVGCVERKKIEVNTTVTEDTKYGAATIALTLGEFESKGFRLGDSCDIEFASGYVLHDVPYYNGYYVKNAAPVLVAYPGYNTVCITYNNIGIWKTAELTEGDGVTIRLAEASKYSAIQDSLGQLYSFDRKDYTHDEEFCNFRALSGGALKENYLYRGASPIDNSRGRAAYTDNLLKKTGIGFIMDLADSETDAEGYFAKEDFASPYAKGLFENGNTVLLSMSSSFQSEDYRKKVVAGIREMMKGEGPFYIHCMEGKDRTGFVCTIIESLCGATYDEMCADYMITYANYYKVSMDKTPEKYMAIAELYFDSFVSFLHGTEENAILKSADYVQDAKDYLISGGMTEAEINAFQLMITK